MTYAVLRVPALAYMLVKAEIAKLPMSDYGHMIDRGDRMRPERLVFDAVGLEAMPSPPVDQVPSPQETRRDTLAAVLELVAKEGLDGPRDLDVAIDAILSVFGEEHAE